MHVKCEDTQARRARNLANSVFSDWWYAVFIFWLSLWVKYDNLYLCKVCIQWTLISGHHRGNYFCPLIAESFIFDLLWPREGYFKDSEFLGCWILKFKTKTGIINTYIRVIRRRSKRCIWYLCAWIPCVRNCAVANH